MRVEPTDSSQPGGQLAQGPPTLGRAGLRVGLDPLKGLFQPKQFHNSCQRKPLQWHAAGKAPQQQLPWARGRFIQNCIKKFIKFVRSLLTSLKVLLSSSAAHWSLQQTGTFQVCVLCKKSAFPWGGTLLPALPGR